MMVNLADMANRVRELRERAGLTQQELADLADTTPQQISRLERGQRKLPPEWMERLAKPLRCRPAALMDARAESLGNSQGGGELVEDAEELMLIDLWRVLPKPTRRAVLTLIQSSGSITSKLG